ncbi:MAG: lipocalin family protein [bacterium]
MKIRLIALLGFALLALFLSGCFFPEDQFTKSLPAQNVDLEKYLGSWYEIVRIPNWFEKDLVGVTATYSLKENGEIEVKNQGFIKTLDGEKKIAIGRAWIPDQNKTGRLKVSFFGPFAGDYIIIELDPDYQYALVGSSQDLLWILSRTPQLDEAIYQNLLSRASSLGYDINRLEKVEQAE